MKKLFTFLSVTALSLLFINSSQAQMFQNTNKECEEIPIIFSPTGVSVSCKYYNADEANFPFSGVYFDSTNLTYPDCVISSATSAITAVNQSSVLMNLATSATACTSGTGDQFATADNYNLTGLTPAATPIGLPSVVAGPIQRAYNTTPVGVSDFAIPLVSTLAPDEVFATAPNAGLAASPIATDDVAWDQGNDTAFISSSTDKNTALVDCDSDGDLDAVIAVANTSSDFYSVNLLLNNGTGLQAVSAQSQTNIVYTSGGASLAIGDFNNDGNDDVVMATNEGAGDSFVEICSNDGACGFTCQDAGQVNLDTLLGSNPQPTSIVAGDFNGDGNVDAALSTPGLDVGFQGILFLFGNGSLAFPSNLSVNYEPTANGDPRTLAVGCFNNDNELDVAMTFGSLQSNGDARVGVFTDITTASVTSTTLGFNNQTDIDIVAGIDSADFDGLGGDDILMVANDLANTTNPRQAFVFMNTVETITANAGADVSTEASSVTLTGTCAIDPADATAVIAPTWTIVSPASGGTLTNATTLTPTLTTTTDASYTLRLTCRTRCDDTATDTVVVTTGGLYLEGSGVASNGCSSSLSPAVPFSGAGIMMMLSSLVLFWSIRRKQ